MNIIRQNILLYTYCLFYKYLILNMVIIDKFIIFMIKSDETKQKKHYYHLKTTTDIQ